MASNSDNRRRSRIQGGWAAQSGGGIRPQEPKSVIAAETAWTLRPSNNEPVAPSPVKYIPLPEVRQDPHVRTISEPGSYDISTEPSGVSRLILKLDFMDVKECDTIFEQLYAELPWQQRIAFKNGEEYLQPRMTAWFGDLPYVYSGIKQERNPQWTPLLRLLKRRVEQEVGREFNSMLANLYRDGHDHVSWHSDDERALGPTPFIASLSFGDVRTFELRKKPPLAETGKEDTPVYLEFIKVALPAGSLLIMEGAVQQDWQHSIPKEYHDRGPRINLTFRVIFEE